MGRAVVVAQDGGTGLALRERSRGWPVGMDLDDCADWGCGGGGADGGKTVLGCLGGGHSKHKLLNSKSLIHTVVMGRISLWEFL